MSEFPSYVYQLEAPVSILPRKVISLFPSLTESLFELQLGDRLVGITNDSLYPAASVANVRRVGSARQPDLETIIALRPDLVMANAEENRTEDISALQAAGIPVWVTFVRTVREAINLLWNIMHVFDEPVMVPRVRLIEQTFDWVEQISETRQPPCKVFMPMALDPLQTFTADTFAHDVLRVCGGVNVFAGRERVFPLKASTDTMVSMSMPFSLRYPVVTLEDVIEAQPDVVLLPKDHYGFTEQHVAEILTLDIPAAHQKQVHLVDGSLVFWHGTRIARALDSLPQILCPSG